MAMVGRKNLGLASPQSDRGRAVSGSQNASRQQAHTPGPLDDVLRNVVLTDIERRLIAAAPDMLAALIALVEGRPTKEPPKLATVAHRNWTLIQQARAAIAKATTDR